jgi:hypothetical protein
MQGGDKFMLGAKTAFDILFFKVDCEGGCRFKLEITFPEEDDN